MAELKTGECRECGRETCSTCGQPIPLWITLANSWSTLATVGLMIVVGRVLIVSLIVFGIPVYVLLFVLHKLLVLLWGYAT